MDKFELVRATDYSNNPYNIGFRVFYRFNASRFAYHHDNTQRSVLSGIYVSIVDESTTEKVTYQLSHESFPLRELHCTLAEQLGVHWEQLQFTFQGKPVPLDATPRSLNMSREGENILTVTAKKKSAAKQRVEMLTRMNRMGKVLVQSGHHQGDFGGDDILPCVLNYCDLASLVNITQVCRHWFHAAQRFSVLLQLQDGDSGTWQSQQIYPRLLHDGCRHAFQLALCSSNESHNVALQKERLVVPAYGLAKAANCTIAKTVALQSISRNLESTWKKHDSAKTQFLEWASFALDRDNDWNWPPIDENSKANISTGQLSAPCQDYPPPGTDGDGYITIARDPRYKNGVVEMFRRYFSPEMHFIFPLIVNSQSALGMDFRSTQTHLIFGDTSSLDQDRSSLHVAIQRSQWLQDSQMARDNLQSPIGAVSWRLHDSAQVATSSWGMTTKLKTTCKDFDNASHQGLALLHGWKPLLILEVLFIAVWEHERGGAYGSRLVSFLEEEAVLYAKQRQYQTLLMYVEIGLEQPKAKLFWGKQGFAPLGTCRGVVPYMPPARSNRRPTTRVCGQRSPGPDSVETVKTDEKEMGFIDRRCFRFTDTEQYGKRIIVC